MHVCLYICMYVCIYAFVWITGLAFDTLKKEGRPMRGFMYWDIADVSMYIYIYVCMYVCMYVYTYVCMYA